MPRALTPKRMLLDLLRVAPTPTPVSALVEIGALFAFQESAVRVALTRLLAAGRVESDERGWYSRAPSDEAKHALVETWRLGEKRLVPWNGRFLAIVLHKTQSRSQRARSAKALRATGYVEILSAFWVRPDNLACGPASPDVRMRVLGLGAEAEALVVDHFTEERTESLHRAWDTTSIRARARDACTSLARSAERLACMPQKEALVEAFVRGGDAIRVLTLDPLLPEELCNGDERRALTDAMLAYDASGRQLWQRLANSRTAHMSLLRQEAS
jgi:phenylacetic acid degradation operon negative regulatory protein